MQSKVDCVPNPRLIVNQRIINSHEKKKRYLTRNHRSDAGPPPMYLAPRIFPLGRKKCRKKVCSFFHHGCPSVQLPSPARLFPCPWYEMRITNGRKSSRRANSSNMEECRKTWSQRRRGSKEPIREMLRRNIRFSLEKTFSSRLPGNPFS